MIEITYQLRGEKSPGVVVLTPEQYFDPLDAGEVYEKHGVPRFDHAWQYLGVAIDRVQWTLLRQSGKDGGSTQRTDFSNNGRSWLLHVVGTDGYEELIHSTDFRDGTTHLIRTHKLPGGVWTINMNVVMSDSPVPTVAEENYH